MICLNSGIIFLIVVRKLEKWYGYIINEEVGGQPISIGEFNILADGLNIAHTAATPSTQVATLLKLFETLTQFAANNLYGVSLGKDNWTFKVKDWKKVVPLCVSSSTRFHSNISLDKSKGSNKCQQNQKAQSLSFQN
jgi:hypothetical protein